MDMRYLEAINVTRAIVHIMDRNGDAPLLNQVEMDITEDLFEFLTKHIHKSLKAEDNKKAKFLSEGAVKRASDRMFVDHDFFVEGSQDIAKHLFQVIKPVDEVLSGDIIVCEFNSGNASFIGVLKMDYVKSFIHEVAFEEDKFKISIVSQDIALPPMNQKLSACAFIKKDDYDPTYDMVMLEKSTGIDDGLHYFLQSFLSAELVFDSRDKTRMFKKNVENWARKNLKNDYERADELRSEVNNRLLTHAVIDMDEVAQEVFGDDLDLKDKFDNNMIETGVNNGETIEIDKHWVQKKMKSRAIKTDTGFTIRADFDHYDDQLRFEVRKNGDGTVDYVIKNVRNITER